MYAIDPMMYKWCLWTLEYCYFKNKNVDYWCIVTGITKSKAIKLLQNIDLTEKVKYYEE